MLEEQPLPEQQPLPEPKSQQESRRQKEQEARTTTREETSTKQPISPPPSPQRLSPQRVPLQMFFIESVKGEVHHIDISNTNESQTNGGMANRAKTTCREWGESR